MKIYNLTDYKISDVNDNIWNYWIQTNNPKINHFAIVPVQPTYDPSTQECIWNQGNWNVINKQILPKRRIWPTAAHFWNEFTPQEQLNIVSRNESEIKVLTVHLTIWPGEVWSDDVRLQSALQILVARNVLTQSRIDELLTAP